MPWSRSARPRVNRRTALRARGGLCVAATWAMLASAPQEQASPPITFGWQSTPRAADTSFEQLAQRAAHTAFSTNSTGALAGLGLLGSASARVTHFD